MKIPASVINHYNRTVESYKPLKNTIDNFFAENKKNVWHYESRIKSQESYAIKLETGRYNKLEDFFACMVVVPNSNNIGEVIKIIEVMAQIIERKPQDSEHTHKRSHEFPFDDLRLYVKWNKEYTEQLFEIQVKTYLQHAWSIATHDLVYKTNDSTWGKARIAYQIKAMLEHVELSISEAEKLSNNTLIKKTHKETDDASLIANAITKWDNDVLSDKKRISETIQSLLREMDVSSTDFIAWLKEKPLLNSLSIYNNIVRCMLDDDTFRNKILNKKFKKFKIFIPDDFFIIVEQYAQVIRTNSNFITLPKIVDISLSKPEAPLD